MPLSSVRIGTPSSGKSAWYLFEHVEGVNYNLVQFVEALLASRPPTEGTTSIDKKEIRALLGLAQSDWERALIRYSVFKSSGLSPTAARQKLGLHDMKEKSEAIQKCIEEAQEIREAIDKVSCVKDKALLVAMGFSTLSSSESDTDVQSEVEATHLSSSTSFTQFDTLPTSTASSSSDAPSRSSVSSDQVDAIEHDAPVPGSVPLSSVSSQLADVLPSLDDTLKSGHYNWFEVVDYVEKQVNSCNLQTILEELHSYVSNLTLTPQEKNLLTNSYAAYQPTQPSTCDKRTAAMLNGDIVSDSESDSAAEYVNLKSLTDDRARRIVSNKRRALSRRTRRHKAKAIAERNFLGRKRSRSIQSVESKFPDIGESIEAFVSDRNVGADAWRRTGVLTFDGNVRVNEKVTYGRIQEYLQEKYSHKFSYGTVVQLCIARNKHRRSAANYKGLAKGHGRDSKSNTTLTDIGAVLSTAVLILFSTLMEVISLTSIVMMRVDLDWTL